MDTYTVIAIVIAVAAIIGAWFDKVSLGHALIVLAILLLAYGGA